MYIVWTLESGNYECYTVSEDELPFLIYEVKRDGGSIFSVDKKVES